MRDSEINKDVQKELLEEGMEMKKQPAKRINIVSLKLVKESSLLYEKKKSAHQKMFTN